MPDVEAASDGYFNATIGGVLDPSGVVKGWAIERVSALLSAAGVRSHAVNGGGDMQLTGARSDGSPWRIGVAHPLRSGALATVVEGRDFAVPPRDVPSGVVTSSIRGPAEHPSALASVTVTGLGITLVDAYATAAYVMGASSRDWIEDLDGYEAFR